MHWYFVAPVPIVLALACTASDSEDPALRAFGNEPFWSVTVSVAGGILYGRMGEEEITFPYQAPRLDEDGSTTRVFGPMRDSSGQHQIEVRILGQDCQDSMADIIHPMRAIVILDGEELSGCARDLDPRPPSESP